MSLALAAIATIAWRPAMAAGHATGEEQPGLVEAQRCRATHALHLPDDPEGAAAPAGDTISVRVPPTAVVKVDSQGRVVAAMTNTGCAPRPGYELYAWREAAGIRPAPLAAPPAGGWTGDFSRPGIFQPQAIG